MGVNRIVAYVRGLNVGIYKSASDVRTAVGQIARQLAADGDTRDLPVKIVKVWPTKNPNERH